MLNTITVITNAAKNAAGTTSLYVVSTSQSPPMITRILPASARNIATSDGAGVRDRFGPDPKPSNERVTRPPAAMLTRPPSTADSAA